MTVQETDRVLDWIDDYKKQTDEAAAKAKR